MGVSHSIGVDVTACEMVEDSIRVESVVRGHHVYKEIWTPELGEVQTVCKEPDNIHDRHAICVKKDGAIVGYVPRELSRTMDVFIEKGGVVTCTVTGRHKKGKGLEVPCVYCLEAKKRLMTKVQRYLRVHTM